MLYFNINSTTSVYTSRNTFFTSNEVCVFSLKLYKIQLRNIILCTANLLCTHKLCVTNVWYTSKRIKNIILYTDIYRDTFSSVKVELSSKGTSLFPSNIGEINNFIHLSNYFIRKGQRFHWELEEATRAKSKLQLLLTWQGI